MSERHLAAWRHTLYRQGYLVLTVAGLLTWARLQPGTANVLLLPAWAVAGQLIFAGSFEAARLRRRAWLGQYLLASSPWHRRLRGGPLMVLRHQLLGLLLALLLLVQLRLLPSATWAVLVMAALMQGALQTFLHRRAARHVVAAYAPALVRRLLVWPVAVLLALLLTLLALWLPQPYLIGLAWEEALVRHVSTAAGGTLLGFFERLAQALELTQYWAMQNAVTRSGIGEGLALVGWLLLLLTQSAFAWAFVRLLVGADALRSRLTRRPESGREESA
ncbi:hypothetical protein HOP62_14795 [Halomonas sp. MCCC 1A17488]|uniref:hypothetical protein n=1 Tax=unclassified Halomonas TaxID=2609666 RepID=UPI0018D252EC|nr:MULTISPECIES: hypothetical protein [unclassified Halomonas]MCE8017345.1 hypothetical protein [Halomonas sp. MCCC 1A17488]MCG3240678.1 hypothetical protein [Halomonas sp. MCCC 1A17488]QPP49482.1 hypothetical protein I4484_20345 [Halomonas sp. SS10-MC5]